MATAVLWAAKGSRFTIGMTDVFVLAGILGIGSACRKRSRTKSTRTMCPQVKWQQPQVFGLKAGARGEWRTACADQGHVPFPTARQFLKRQFIWGSKKPVCPFSPLVVDFVNIPSYSIFCGLKYGLVEGGPAWPGLCEALHAQPARVVDGQTFDQTGVVVAPRREGALPMLVSFVSPAFPASPTDRPSSAVLAYP